jgi:hypothetical protein
VKWKQLCVFGELSEAAPFLKRRADAVAFSRRFPVQEALYFLEAEGDSSEGDLGESSTVRFGRGESGSIGRTYIPIRRTCIGQCRSSTGQFGWSRAWVNAGNVQVYSGGLEVNKHLCLSIAPTMPYG